MLSILIFFISHIKMLSTLLSKLYTITDLAAQSEPQSKLLQLKHSTLRKYNPFLWEDWSVFATIR